MHRKGRSSILLCVVLILVLGACSRVPDNAKYIPADATAVAGINLRSLSKKIAWNLITGSKLYKEMQKRMSAQGSADAMKGIENAGIDVSNTFYIYTRSDTRFAGGNLMVALVPLADAGRWEAYVKQVFDGTPIQVRQDRKEAAPGEGMYVGWTNDLLIIINGTMAEGSENDAAQLIAAEMARAFMVPSGSNIVGNSRFAALAKGGYDLSFWLNYGSLITDLTGDVSVDLNGVSLSSAVWRDAVLTAGFDFKKGKISGAVNYYLPAQVEEATKDFGTVRTDKDLLDRLPKKDLDMLVSMHISPAGVKTLLEKVGLFGPANVGLTTQGLDMDYVLGAFTGDMVIAMNNFSLRTETLKEDFMGQEVAYRRQRATMNMTYAVKIGNPDNFARLLEMTAGTQMQRSGSGYVFPLTTDDSLHLQMSREYAVMSNRHEYAEGILDGRYKGDKMPREAADKAYDNPFAICVDIKQMLGKVDPAISSSPRDSAIIAESKKLLDNVTLYGGNYIDNAYKFDLEINFADKDENSILELIDFGMRMNDLSNIPDR
ncbi:hypothetical protein GCM10023093_08110 [Nemorincola caseinilytica]|uniref:DUF4836 family protein n=1 Tax=Nemorincola caseinilytica TaxID=2054315 RepID=A0ABP8N9E6_9BACT